MTTFSWLLRFGRFPIQTAEQKLPKKKSLLTGTRVSTWEGAHEPWWRQLAAGMEPSALGQQALVLPDRAAPWPELLFQDQEGKGLQGQP